MKVIFVILFIGLNFTQSTSLSLYGVGEKYGIIDVSAISLGNSAFFSGNKYNISTNSPSSLWRSALTRFAIYSGMNYLTNSHIPKQYEHSLTFFSLSFPIGNKKVVGLGLQPAFRTNKIELEETIRYTLDDPSFTGENNFAYNNKYFIKGGGSKIFLQYSQKTGSNYSIGIQYSSLFGNQFLDDYLYIYDDGNDTIIYPENDETIHVTKSHQFSGSEILIEGRYSNKKQEWIVRTGFNGKTKVQTEITQFPNHYLNENISKEKLSELAFGYQYKTSNHSGILSELHINYPFNIPDAVTLFNTMPPKETSIHFGTYYQYVNPKIGFWNNINLRLGGYLKELDFTKEKNSDYGITWGIGLEYLAHTQSLDFAFRAGKRDSFIIKGEKENYFSFHIGIISGEKWFMKKRRK